MEQRDGEYKVIFENEYIYILLNSTLFNSYLYSFSQIKYERHNKKYE